MQFKNLNYEGIADKVRPTRKDSALHMPIFKIDIIAVDGTKKSAMFYKKPVDPGTLDDLGKEEYFIEPQYLEDNDLLLLMYLDENQITK